MRKLITAILVLVSLSAISQGGTFNANGKLVSGNSDSALTLGQQISLTSDTTKKFGFATISGNLWFFDKTVGYWKQTSSGGSALTGDTVNTPYVISKYSKSAFSNIVGDSLPRAVTDTAFFAGDSYQAGYGLNNNYLRYPTLYSEIIGAVETNYAISGTSLCIGDSNLLTRLYVIPTNRATVRAVWLAYGTNDALNGADTATYRAAWKTVFDNCIAKGLAGKVIVSGAGYNTTSYSTIFARYSLIAQQEAANYGFTFVDITNILVSNNTTATMQSDSLHPNYLGAKLIAENANKAFVTYQNSYQVVNGNQTVNGNLKARGNIDAVGLALSANITAAAATLSGNVSAASVTDVASVTTTNAFPQEKVTFYKEGADATKDFGVGLGAIASMVFHTGYSQDIMFTHNQKAATANRSNVDVYVDGTNGDFVANNDIYGDNARVTGVFSTNITNIGTFSSARLKGDSLTFNDAFPKQTVLDYRGSGATQQWGSGLNGNGDKVIHAGASKNILLAINQDAYTATPTHSAFAYTLHRFQFLNTSMLHQCLTLRYYQCRRVLRELPIPKRKPLCPFRQLIVRTYQRGFHQIVY